MKRILVLISFVFCSAVVSAQGNIAEAKFHEGSNFYINGNTQAALTAVNAGLKTEPSNAKLLALKKELEEKKKQEQEQKKKEEQQKKEQEQKNKDQQKQDKQNKDQQKQDQEKKDQQKQEEKKNEEKKDEEKKDQKDEKKDPKENKEDKENKEKSEEQRKKEEQQKREDLPPEVKERLEQMKIPEEKARMLLEAMRNQEIQYLQQDKRKATKKPESTKSGKPDW